MRSWSRMKSVRGYARVLVRELEKDDWTFSPERRVELETIADNITGVLKIGVASAGLERVENPSMLWVVARQVRRAGPVWAESRDCYRDLRKVYDLTKEEKHFMDHAVAKRFVFGIKLPKEGSKE